MPRLLAAALLLTAVGCGRCANPAPPATPRPPATHLLVTDDGDGVLVQHGHGAAWEVHRRLPAQARAVRVSPNGAHVAWVLDLTDKAGTTLSRGFVWTARDDRPVSLGTLGFRKREAMGLTVGDDGGVTYLDESGRLQSRAPDGTTRLLGEGTDALAGPGGRLAFVPVGGGCLATLPTKLNACGGLLQPLAWDGDRLVFTAEHFVFVAQGKEALPYPELREPAMAGLLGSRLFVQRRKEKESITMDVLDVVDAPGAPARQVLESAVIVSVAWDSDGQLLVVTRPQRRDLYELLLAHAPAEFSGELFSGDPVLVDPTTGVATPAIELPSRRVRQWRPLVLAQ